MKKVLVLLCLGFALCLIKTTSLAEENESTKDEKRQQYINEIGFNILNSNRIEQRMMFYYKPNDRSVNACAYYRDRKIQVYKGIAAYLESDDEYAAILSHEISHGIDYYSGPLRGYFSYISGIFPSASRKNERKADKRAVDFMVKAGYNPLALIVTMSKFMSQPRYEFYASHPLTSRRMMYVYEYIYNKYPEYLANNEYKNNVYYQNFLLTSRQNRLKMQEKIKNNQPSKRIPYL